MNAIVISVVALLVRPAAGLVAGAPHGPRRAPERPASASTRWPAGRRSRRGSCARRSGSPSAPSKLALPGYMILAQVPLARFLNVPKRNSYAEWMRRLGNQCVDFVVCDVTSQVVAVVEVRPPIEQLEREGRAPARPRRARAEGRQDPAARLERGEAADDRGGARRSSCRARPAVPAGMARSRAPALASRRPTVSARRSARPRSATPR